MKKIIPKVMLIIASVFMSINIYAYDFEVDGFYYNIISTGDLTCEVTHSGLGNQNELYTGNIEIPATTNYRDKEWKVVAIGDSTFYNCSNLTKITLHTNIVSVGVSSFQNCKWLSGINLPESITSIGKYAFYGCEKLNSISLPPLIKTIEPHTFNNSINLEKISLPDSLIEIQDYALCNIGINSIELPKSVQKLGKMAFAKCNRLENLLLSDSLVIVGDSVFAGSSNIKKIIIPKKVKQIGRGAFYGCSRLKELIVDSMNLIYDSREKSNSIIETATNKLIYATSATIIPNSVTTIGSYAFSGVTIKELSIPPSIKEIEDYAFNNCSNLNKLNISDSEVSLKLGIAYDGYTIRHNYVFAKGLFYDCSLTELYIGRDLIYPSYDEYNKMSTISPFQENKKLKNAIFGDFVTDIGCSLFEDCNNLQSVQLSKRCVIIRNSAFYNTKITEIIIPKSVELIEAYAFGTSPLNKIYFEDGINKITIRTRSIYNFSQCKDVYIGREVTENSSNELFPNVESVVIGDSVKTIKSNLFSNCVSLKTLDLGKNLTEIDDNAFLGCNNITQITTRNTTPPANAVFSNDVYMDADVKVPYNTLEIYKSETNWRNFWNISEMDFSGIDGVINDGAETVVDVYNLQGVRVRKGVKRNEAIQDLPQGIYIINGEKILVK